MALEQDDIIRIQMVMKEEIKPFANKLFEQSSQIQSINQTLYGVNKDNGIYHEMKDMAKRIGSLEVFKTRVIAGFTVVQGAVISYFKFFNKQ